MLPSIVIQVFFNKLDPVWKLVPVAYFSGNFDKAQVKWNITEKEAYAIYKSVKKFAFYITGAKTSL